MSETRENLINSETNQNDDIPKKSKEVEKSQALIDGEQGTEAKLNGLEGEERNGLEIEKQNGVVEEREKKHEWEDLLGSGSLMKKIVNEGHPDTRPMRLERCFINYECRLEDGTLVDEKENFEVLLGDCEVKNL